MISVCTVKNKSLIYRIIHEKCVFLWSTASYGKVPPHFQFELIDMTRKHRGLHSTAGKRQTPSRKLCVYCRLCLATHTNTHTHSSSGKRPKHDRRGRWRPELGVGKKGTPREATPSGISKSLSSSSNKHNTASPTTMGNSATVAPPRPYPLPFALIPAEDRHPPLGSPQRWRNSQQHQNTASAHEHCNLPPRGHNNHGGCT